jgi:hypothetical protein
MARWGPGRIMSKLCETVKLRKKTLASLSCFTNLRQFVFNVEWDVKKWPVSLETYWPCYWPGLLHASFSALAQSRGAFSDLHVKGLPPYNAEVPYWWLRNWDCQELLRGLKRLEITFLGVTFEDRPEPYGLSATEIHNKFISGLGSMFLNQLLTVEHLGLIGRPDGHLTVTGIGPGLCLEEVCMMPNLKSFEIECAILSEPFTRFIIRQLPRLHKVHMRRCINYDWIRLFEGIVAAKPRQLTNFTVGHFPALRRGLYPTEEQWKRAEKELGEQLGPNGVMEEADARLRLFPYGYLA